MIFTLNNLDLLRHILDVIALVDRRTALKLALLSKITQAWVEPIIYSDVNLRHQTSARAFLYTIRTSKSKPPSFFAKHLKSLVISSDVDPRTVVEILSVCQGIINFSYWPSQPPIKHSPNQRLIPIFDHLPSHKTLVAPQRMSILLYENLIYPLKPHFNLAFFSSLTHLSILNSWEEWTTWSYLSSNVMPSLTHLKFDLNVQLGNRRPSQQNSSELDLTKNYHQVVSTTTSELSQWWLDMKLSTVTNTLIDVLANSRTLLVCILLLRFDTHPHYTAQVITRLASRKLLHGGRTTQSPPPPDSEAVNLFDPRLVFAHERQPFRYTHAHSKHEMMLWESAEIIADSQKHLTGYTLLDCGI